MKLGIRLSLMILGIAVMITSCREKTKPLVGKYYSSLLFGKPFTIDVVGDSTDYLPQIDSIVNAFEMCFDVNNPSSIISQLNRYERMDSVFRFNDSTRVFGMVYDLTRDLNAATLQYYDPTIGPLRRAWLISGVGLSNEPNLDSIYQFVGFDGAKLDLNEMTDTMHIYTESQIRKSDPRIEADFTMVAAGMALDHIADFLKSKNVKQFRISFGKDIITWGEAVDSLNVVSLGITSDSSDQNLKLRNMAFSCRTGKEKAGMIDPTYGYPVDNEMAFVAVAAPTMAEATVFAESFMTMGLEKASEYYSKNDESKIQSFMFYLDVKDSTLRNASTDGFDRMIIIPESEETKETN